MSHHLTQTRQAVKIYSNTLCILCITVLNSSWIFFIILFLPLSCTGLIVLDSFQEEHILILIVFLVNVSLRTGGWEHSYSHSGSFFQSTLEVWFSEIFHPGAGHELVFPTPCLGFWLSVVTSDNLFCNTVWKTWTILNTNNFIWLKQPWRQCSALCHFAAHFKTFTLYSVEEYVLSTHFKPNTFFKLFAYQQISPIRFVRLV